MIIVRYWETFRLVNYYYYNYLAGFYQIGKLFSATLQKEKGKYIYNVTENISTKLDIYRNKYVL